MSLAEIPPQFRSLNPFDPEIKFNSVATLLTGDDRDSEAARLLMYGITRLWNNPYKRDAFFYVIAPTIERALEDRFDDMYDKVLNVQHIAIIDLDKVSAPSWHFIIKARILQGRWTIATSDPKFADDTTSLFA